MTDQELEQLGEENLQLARENAVHILACAKSKLNFDTILSSKINEYYKVKKNIGHETARLMLLSEQDKEVIKYDNDYHINLAQHKGKESISKALVERINIEKSIRKSIL